MELTACRLCGELEYHSETSIGAICGTCIEKILKEGEENDVDVRENGSV